MVVEFVVLVFLSTIEPVGEPSSGRDGNRCKEGLALYVTNGEDAFDVRLLPIIDDDVPLGIKLDTDVLKAQVLCICLATDRPKDCINLDRLARIEMNFQGATTLTLDLDDIAVSVEIDAGALHPWQEHVLQGRVKRAEDFVVARDEMCLCAQRVQYACKFDCDVPRANDRNALGLILEGEEPIRVNAKGCAGYLVVRWDDWMPARADDHLVSVDGIRRSILATNLDMIRRGELGVTAVVCDTFPGDILVVYSVQKAYIFVALGLERGPGELWWFALGKIEMVAMRGVA